MMKKRLTALLLTVAMCLSLLYIPALAADETTPAVSGTYQDGVVTVSGSNFVPNLRYSMIAIKDASGTGIARRGTTARADGSLSIAIDTGEIADVTGYTVTVYNDLDGEIVATGPITPYVATYAVTLTVNKDGAVWADHGKTFTLKSGETVVEDLTQVPVGTYNLYDGEVDTGETVEVVDQAVAVTLNYYTVSFAVVDDSEGTSTGSTISATYAGADIASGDVLLGGKGLVITAVGAGTESYIYAWSGTGTNGEMTAALTIDPLVSAVDATCTVTGSETPPVSYAVTVIGGTADVATAKEGDIVTLTATVGQNQRFVKWTILPETVTLIEGTLESEIVKFMMPAEAVTATAEIKDDLEPSVVIAPPEVDSSGLEGVTEEQKTAIVEAANTVKTSGNVLAEAVAADEGLQNKLAVSDTEKAAAVAELAGKVPGATADTTKLLIQTYLAIKPTAFSAVESKVSLIMDITPMARTVITLATTQPEDVEIGTNAVVAKEGQPFQPTGAVEISVNLPAVFVVQTPVYIRHGNYEYRSKWNDDGSIKFTAPHGFSPFEFSTDSTSEAWIGDVGSSFQNALNNVQSGETIQVTKNGLSGTAPAKAITFTITGASDDVTSWTIGSPSGYTVTRNGNTYTVTRNTSSGGSSGGGSTGGSSSSGGSGGGGGGGGGGGSSSSSKVTITRPENGTVTCRPSNPSKGETVTLTVKPKAGYELDRLVVTDKNGNEITLTDIGDGKFTFTMPDSKVTVNATFKTIGSTVTPDTPEKHPFTDVSSDTWYSNAVQYMYEKGMMTGVTKTTFAPTQIVDRATIVTMLHRLEGTPAGGTATFPDVAPGQWYSQAIAWAASNGVVLGYENGKFGPSDTITREQMAVILYRYAQNKGYDVSTSGSLASFSDSGKVSDWASDAMRWAVGTGLLTGKGGGILDPGGQTTRAEVATILMRFCENIAK